jgi:hypothetical protein
MRLSKGTSLRENTSFEPLTIKIGLAVRTSPVKEVRKKTKVIKKKETEIDMKRGFWGSGPREPIVTEFCTEGQGRTKMFHAMFGVSRSIGLGAMRGTNFGLCL